MKNRHRILEWFICRPNKHLYEYSGFWNDDLKINLPMHRCIICGKESEWSKKERDHMKASACPKCGAYIDSSGMCTYCNYPRGATCE